MASLARFCSGARSRCHAPLGPWLRRARPWRCFSEATAAAENSSPSDAAAEEGGSSSSSRPVVPPDPGKFTGKRVDQLPISEAMKQNLYGMGITRLFEIQARAFDLLFKGRSFVGRSKTGTGKTIAYLLPLLERLRQEKLMAAHCLLVLVPTRELCKQVGGTVLSLSVTTDVALLYSGPSMESQEDMVRLGASVVIATPGRCANLLEKGVLQPKSVRALVIDEADAMMGPEYLGRVEKVLSAVAKKSLQTILFSASLTPSTMSVINRFITNYDLVDLVDRGGLKGKAAVQQVMHYICKVPPHELARGRVLVHLLESKLSLFPGSRCIIFVDSVTEARVLVSSPVLDRRARALHSETTSKDRDATITSFENREFDVLVTTDIVSRGVDFKDVALVLHFHPPKNPSNYIHRAGRTGRGGSGGISIMLYDPREHKRVKKIREVTKQNFRMERAPGPEDIHHNAVSRLLDQLLLVQPEKYEPLLPTAEKLLQEEGPRILATAMAVLDSRHASLERATRSAPSMLTGRKGYLCMLAHDPNHSAAQSEGDLMRQMLALLPKGAPEAAVGHTVMAQDGWAFDLDQRYAGALVEDLRTGRKSAPCEISVARQLPRLLRDGKLAQGPKKAPWANLRRRASKRRAQQASAVRTLRRSRR